jgi:hypothetical protein
MERAFLQRLMLVCRPGSRYKNRAVMHSRSLPHLEAAALSIHHARAPDERDASPPRRARSRAPPLRGWLPRPAARAHLQPRRRGHVAVAHRPGAGLPVGHPGAAHGNRRLDPGVP